ncbi:MAG: glutamine synthetase III, partial [Bacteroidia bacterium]|nr:glutamine synthetase III [Bacteroidia bacterium]
LVQQEPDASSFPSGGIRNTFEARGYTAWDPTSHAFVVNFKGGGGTLCIPTVFVSYTGEALDYKTPLLKALDKLDKAATGVCNYFDRSVTSVTATLGVEQEYFLVDEAMFYARPDLVLTGRTLFGHRPAKGQQLDDHYFGSIPERAFEFMQDFEKEALKLGIPLRTRHNEVAPSQFECAPIFEDVNLAVDHNQLLMDVMEKVARWHRFKVLLHEKPYAEINGSGKHNNWSMATNTGKNLLSPGRTPKEHLMFIAFLVNVLKAVHEHSDLLRASIASAGNDHRLGANEAPPAIISAFLGSKLTEVLDEIEKTTKYGSLTEEQKTAIKIDIAKIPDILLDNTDRNRTSPFAFTGSKFELRAVGSMANNSAPMLIINTIVANQLIEFKNEVDRLMSKGKKKDTAIIEVIRRLIKESKPIRFEGNNYSEEWVKEAKKRGLSNIKDTPRAIEAYVSKKTVELFEKHSILSKRELHSRHEIRLETYAKKIQIESRIMGEMITSYILPSVIGYQNQLIENIKGLKDVGIKASGSKVQKEILAEISDHIQAMVVGVEEMIEARRKANKIEDTRKLAIAYRDKVYPFFDKIRYHVDKLEHLVDDKAWPLPKYRELLFVK